MHLSTFVLAALPVTLINGLKCDATLVSESTHAEPGFTWCYEPYTGGRCVTAATLPDQCLNVSLADNDKAFSATAHPNLHCTMYNRYNCGTNGETLEILTQAPIERFSDYKFSNKMGPYGCKWVVEPPHRGRMQYLVTGIDGTDYRYLGTWFTFEGFYGGPGLRAPQARALAVSCSYTLSTLNRLNLRVVNGPSVSSTFPSLGGIVSSESGVLSPRSPSYIPLGGTCETPPLDNPRTFSSNNSFSPNSFTVRPVYLENPIWRSDLATQDLSHPTAQDQP